MRKSLLLMFSYGPNLFPIRLCSLFAYSCLLLTHHIPETKTAEFATSVDLDEVAHIEPPHLNLLCLSCSF